MDNEKLLETNLRNGAKKRGGWAVKFWPLSLAGFPDRFVLMPGAKTYFVEMKTTGKKPSPIQRIMHAKLLKLGFKVWVIDTQEILNDFFNEISK